MTIHNISPALRRQIIERANNRCEYCLLLDTVAFFSHEIDHIIALNHGGQTLADNLAYACWRCNRHKGSDLGSFDPLTRNFSMLYNPRTQLWIEHFAIQGAFLIGISPEGRTTVYLLQLNSDERVVERQHLIEHGLY